MTIGDAFPLARFRELAKICQPVRGGIATAAPTNACPSLDGALVLIAANSQPLFAKLMTLIGRPGLIGVPRFTGDPAATCWPAPPIGAHNEDVLPGLLEMRAEAVTEQCSGGVI